jgi:hypothetical protein
MGFPATRDALIEAGYRFDNYSTCRGEDCGADVEWWVTPLNKKLPFNLMQNGDSKVVPHWASCPNSDDFRRSR